MDEEKSAALRAEFEEKRRAPKLKFGADYYENRSAVQKEWDEGLDMGAERSEALRSLNANGRKAPSRSRPAKVPADPELLGQIFDLFDYDQSGHIEEKEGLAMAFYLDKTDMEKSAYWARLLSKMDTDGDSRISRDEYIAFHKEMTHTTAAELKSTLLNKGLPKDPAKSAEEAAAAAAAAHDTKIRNLHKRFPSRSRPEVEASLKLMGGHAGNAAGLLAKLPAPPTEASEADAAAMEAKVTSLHARFPEKARHDVEVALQVMDGHAGDAASVLQGKLTASEILKAVSRNAGPRAAAAPSQPTAPFALTAPTQPKVSAPYPPQTPAQTLGQGVPREGLPPPETQRDLLNSLHAQAIYFPKKGCVPLGAEDVGTMTDCRGMWFFYAKCPTCGEVLNGEGDEFDLALLGAGVDGGRY